MQELYYISHSGKSVGPFGVDEIITKINKKELQPTDYIYDETKKDWVVLLEYDLITKRLPSLTKLYPKKPRKVDDSSSFTIDREWFMLKGENRFGPFTYFEVVEKLQKKEAFEFDFIWHHKMTDWKRIAEVEDFNPDKIKELSSQNEKEIKEIFFRRRHTRASYGGSVVVHDNKSIWKGQGLEISAGGAAVIVNTPNLQPGQKIYLHFKPGDGVPPFNALCEVVSKQFVPGSSDELKQIRYGVKFESVSQATVQSIKNYTKKKAA